jgi:Selenocysteine synthase N terminal
MADQTATLLRELPSIDRLLNHARGAALLSRYNHDYVTQKCREALHIGLIAGEYPATSKANSKARPPWSKAWGGIRRYPLGLRTITVLYLMP